MNDFQNGFVLADGEDAKVQSEQSNKPVEKFEYVKLSAGESIKVMLLDAKFPNYYCHGDYNEKIPSHVCTAPRPEMKCKSCEAGVKRTVKYLVPLYDLDKKAIVLWDTSKKHVSAVYGVIEAYGDDVNAEVFQLKRTGSSAQDTAYSFIALPPKQKAAISIPDDVKSFTVGSQERSDFYNGILRAPSDDYIAKILAKVVAMNDAAPFDTTGNENNF